jgi:AcrR family transcriptional regulator
MSTQVDRSAATRENILTVARIAFVRDGYDGASLDKISKDAGVSKGALYHHYSDKKALFAALFQRVCLEVVNAVGVLITSHNGSARDQLKAASISWLKTIEASDARTILLDLGPRVLGYNRARALEDEIALKPLLGLVEAVIRSEKLANDISPLFGARLINATLTEIAILRHGPKGAAPTISTAEKALTRVIDGVLRNA